MIRIFPQVIRDHVLRHKPDDSQAWSNLGWIHEQLNESGAAIEAYIKATEKNSRVADYW
jgi:cytochrome c-type biogenesis protein CcmH/NrfG